MEDCSGPSTVLESCNIHACPGIYFNGCTCFRIVCLFSLFYGIMQKCIGFLVDCEWNAWRVSECSQSCGYGFRRKTRAPIIESGNGGINCPGLSSIVESCNIRKCPGI